MRRALGKGLAQLIGEQPDAVPSEAPVGQLKPNVRQPRARFDLEALDELAASIREHGVLQPILVRPAEDGGYEIIAGERRWRAAQKAGLPTVPIVVRHEGEQGSLELAVIENVQREDITPVEAARAYRRLIDEFRLTQERVAEKVGKSRAAIANTLRLLRLPAPILEGLESGAILEGHAKALLAVGDPALQIALFERIVEKGLTVRDVEQAAQASPAKKPRAKASARATPDPHWRHLEEGMSTYFKSPVKLQPADVGGRIVIDFYSDEDLERILEVLGIRL